LVFNKKEGFIMAFTLTGVVQGMRALSGVAEHGSRKGEHWEFVSLEIGDTKFVKTYSCQLRNNDKQFKEYTEMRSVVDPKDPTKKVERLFLKDGKDLTGHKVKVYVQSVTAGDREIDKKDVNGQAFKEGIIQVRFFVTGIEDKGEPKDDE
jgi:hypothetical protein